MPSRFKHNGLFIDFNLTENIIPEFNGVETVNCPECGYKIPIKEEFVDYKVLYEGLKEYCNKLVTSYHAILDGVEEDIPEAKIYFHNKRCELNNLFNELKNRFAERDEGDI